MAGEQKSVEQRLAELEADVKEYRNRWWRLQGRLNALEALASMAIFDRAQMAEYPRAWVVQFVDQVRRGTLKTLTADVLVAKGDEKRLKQEVVTAMEEILEETLRRAADTIPEQNPYAIFLANFWKTARPR